MDKQMYASWSDERAWASSTCTNNMDKIWMWKSTGSCRVLTSKQQRKQKWDEEGTVISDTQGGSQTGIHLTKRGGNILQGI